MKEHSINKLNNFISAYYIDKKVCDDLINYFEMSPNKTPGMLYGTSKDGMVDKSKKSSTDVAVSIYQNINCVNRYLMELGKCTAEFKKQYMFCDKNHDPWNLCSVMNIQKYEPTESYSEWHCECSGLENIYRHLTYITYLNDVKEGGETEWYHQKIKIKPEKGLTVISGTTWQMVHRGLPAPKEKKYIATGNYGFIVNQ